MRAIFAIPLIAVVILAAGTGTAQQVTAPILTYVTDEAGALHPLLGIPGAATVGSPLNVGFGIRKLVMPSAHDYLLARTGKDSWPVVVQVHGETITARSIRQGGSGIERVAVSPSGSAAAFFVGTEGRIYAYGNLSKSPALIGQFQVEALGRLTALAISDTGRTAMAGFSDGTSGALYFLTVDGEPRLIASMRHPSAIQFLWHSNFAVIADDIDNKVYGFTDGPVFPIATEQDGISVPIDIAVAGDNSKAFVINAGSQSITKIGPDGDVAPPVHCDCTLTGLHPTSTDSVYRVTDFSGGPVLLFDGSARVPRMIFVPVGPQE